MPMPISLLSRPSLPSTRCGAVRWLPCIALHCIDCFKFDKKRKKEMEQLKLTVNGPSQLSGHVRISGSKNSSLPILAASLCCSSGSTLLRNVPSLSDTRAMASVLRSLGAQVAVDPSPPAHFLICADCLCTVEPCPDQLSQLRGGFFVIGPLLARFGEAVVALPGGCDIGSRPVDLYIRGLAALGAVVELRDGRIKARVSNGTRLVGANFHLDYPSVGATETLMMAASLADGVTLLSNVAREPEVIDLARFLNTCGARVYGAGTPSIRIVGQTHLHGTEFTIMPDRIEAGTFLLAAAITRSTISISPVVPSHLSSLVHKLQVAGCKFRQCGHDSMEVSAVCENVGKELQSFNVKTGPFPGFPTDLQPQTMALLTTCLGLSIVEESVFERRMSHVQELRKLGSRIDLCGGSRAIIYGKGRKRALYGSEIAAADLRGGASLVLAALAAEGRTEINGAAHIYRGYQDIHTKLAQLGADIHL